MELGRTRVLIVDDDPMVRRVLRELIRSAGHVVVEADGLQSALRAIRATPPDVALVDHHLGDGTAADLLRELAHASPLLPIVVFSGDPSVELAASSIKLGAFDYVAKPPDPARLLGVLQQALERGAVRPRPGQADPFCGTSPAIRSLAGQAAALASGAAPVLLVGESGVGKTELARWIHAHSDRRGRPLLEVSSAEAASAAFEEELFGAASGSRGSRPAPGLMERIAGGALYVDEIGDLSSSLQARLLRAVEENRIRRPGAHSDVLVDVRLFAATRKDLGRLVREGTFREDLYYRIAAAPVRVPPLRERREDLAPLIQHVLATFGPAQKRAVHLADDAMRALEQHDWPGNCRELRSVVERAVLVADGPVVYACHLSFTRPAAGEGEGAGKTLAEVERAHILGILASCGSNVGEAARKLGIPRSTLYERLKQHGIERSRRSRDDR